MRLYFRTRLKSPVETIKARFTRELFVALAPPWTAIEILRFDGCKKGDEVHLSIKSLGRPQQWISHITDEGGTDSGWFFVDEGKSLPWPLTYWHHRHGVEKSGDHESKIIDDIVYRASNRFLEWLIYPVLWATFAIRPKRYQQFFGEKQ